MASGPEHYGTAEAIIETLDGVALPAHQMNALLATAQIHATLALAAATALNDNDPGMPAAIRSEWLNATANVLTGAHADDD
jgi:hypothetical protein